MEADASCDCVPEKIRLLISDVDGTLLTPEKALTERTCEAVAGCTTPELHWPLPVRARRAA